MVGGGGGFVFEQIESSFFFCASAILSKAEVYPAILWYRDARVTEMMVHAKKC